MELVNTIKSYTERYKNKSIFILNKLKIIKANSSDSDVVDGISEIEKVVKDDILETEKMLIDVRSQFDSYAAQFSSTYDIAFETSGDNTLILRRIRNGFAVLLVNKIEGQLYSGLFVDQIEAFKNFIKKYKELQ